MKHFLFLFFVSMIFNSCCLFSSKDCPCTPPKANVVDSTKDWIIPFNSGEYVFEKDGSLSDEQIVQRDYEEGKECLGGDECCTMVPAHRADFSYKYQGRTSILLNTESVEDRVEFSVQDDRYISIASLNVVSGRLSPADYINAIKSDTLINGVINKKLTFQNTDPTKKILFQELEFIKGIGVVSYTDTSGVAWRKK